jgi:hypothetical protein
MSNYSFIDEDLNDPNKQCFCIDVNSTKAPFISGDFTQVKPESSTFIPRREQQADVVPFNDEKSQNYLIEPSIDMDEPSKREERYITALNRVTEELNMLKDIMNVKASNDIEPSVPRHSMTKQHASNDDVSVGYEADSDDSDNSDEDTGYENEYDVDLNTMANIDDKRYRRADTDLSLFEDFQSGCSDVCAVDKKSSESLSSVAMKLFKLMALVALVLYGLMKFMKK